MLEMGERIRIVELAERMIRLRGLRPGVDIPIEFTGLRLGEKLHEELIEAEERREATAHAQIYRVLAGSRGSNGSDLRLLEGWIQSTLSLPENELHALLRSYGRTGLGRLVMTPVEGQEA
jgi:FlaA1/EpsC-like NDP-sugar epimerase